MRPTAGTIVGVTEVMPAARDVTRSRQVYMKWVWKHCLLLSILPG